MPINTVVYGVDLMPYFNLIVFLFGLYVATFEAMHIIHDYDDSTPRALHLASSLQAVGSVFFIFSPFFCGSLVLMGRVIFSLHSARWVVHKDKVHG